ncbi:hypothetical protein DPX16_16262 [Anabarilius grahami]|uniref:Uncharacterized protein n=1 Tax=Anabarilius grahami TaxID=495550 RepID=A0A3N0XJX0_ANAGA|nr:hypothetical protein DPX16_16262 [Anabarilius grahami]
MADKQSKLPIPRVAPAHKIKTGKRKKTDDDDKKAKKKELDRARNKTRVNIGPAFPRWRELRVLKGLKTDAELATFLLDNAETTDRNDKDLSEDEDTPTLQSRLRKQRKIFSKSRPIDPAGEDGTVMVNDKRVDLVQNNLISETSHSGSNNESQALPKSLSKTLQKITERLECARVLSNTYALKNVKVHAEEKR